MINKQWIKILHIPNRITLLCSKKRTGFKCKSSTDCCISPYQTIYIYIYELENRKNPANPLFTLLLHECLLCLCCSLGFFLFKSCKELKRFRYCLDYKQSSAWNGFSNSLLPTTSNDFCQDISIIFKFISFYPCVWYSQMEKFIFPILLSNRCRAN